MNAQNTKHKHSEHSKDLINIEYYKEHTNPDIKMGSRQRQLEVRAFLAVFQWCKKASPVTAGEKRTTDVVPGTWERPNPVVGATGIFNKLGQKLNKWSENACSLE